MGMEDKKPFCPVLDVDGVIAGGKQFDLDITLPDVNKKKYYFYFIKEKAPLGANSRKNFFISYNDFWINFIIT